MGSRNSTHPCPTLLIGDFGHAERITPLLNNSVTQANLDLKQRFTSTKGTQDYNTPEQFHRDWEARNWFDSDIAGNFNGFTYNLFGVGQIMYQIVTCLYDPPDIGDPFLPSYPISGAPALGRTFGPDLNAYAGEYSKVLTDLIYECLYENPTHRPTLETLKYEITRAYNLASQDDDNEIEPWKNFTAPTPLDQPVNIPADKGPRKRVQPTDPPSNFFAVKTRIFICQGVLKNGLQCGNRLRGKAGDARPRCAQCIRRRR
ncbi:uncharacterized protein LY89DRAFT_326955 [Mollisia scopiformis]|uniref:Protein kinase domain-containing protein n=1 Tax=Mollisia scopiformis TaxID=149040 RepID=A0A132BA06_MOLSC|nr:uncharacterized protein LY89DRAFT_326955 [Mollisia scopiformis]KUJ08829.1 hypothetical protein LY89DRAFT_326955 [Mollisia scopiformis]